jgi:hypothetical protein
MPKIAIVTSYPIELGGVVFPVGTELARFDSKHEVDRIVSLLGAKAAVMTEISDDAEEPATVVAEVEREKTGSETVDPATSKAATDTTFESEPEDVRLDGLDSRLVKVLTDFGVRDWAQLGSLLDDGLELDSIPGVGKKAIPKIMSAFEAWQESVESQVETTDAPVSGRSDPAEDEEDLDDDDDLSPDE